MNSKKSHKFSSEINFRISVLLLALLCYANVGFSQNPLKLATGGLVSGSQDVINDKAAGWTDPSLRVYNGVAYLVVGRDADPEQTSGFEMPYWCIFSSTDLRTWTLAIKITPDDLDLGTGFKACWAADIAQDPNNGNPFYFYYSRGGDGIGIARLNHNPTTRTFTLGAPFNSNNTPKFIQVGTPNSEDHDPTIFFKNGFPYMLYGKDGYYTSDIKARYKIARLRNDAFALQDIATVNGIKDTKPIVLDATTVPVEGFGQSPSIARDHGYFHTFNGRDYVSCSGAYLMAGVNDAGVNSPFGPYKGWLVGGVKKKYGVGPDNRPTPGHSSYSAYNGQWYHTWEFSYDRSKGRNFRKVQMTYLHYKDNGEMVDDVAFLDPLDKAAFDPDNIYPEFGARYLDGVGAYDANWKKIQAEWFFKKSAGVDKIELPGPSIDFQVAGMSDGDEIVFPKVRNVPTNVRMNFRFSSIGTGQIQVRTGDGIVRGTLSIDNTLSFNTYKDKALTLNIPAGNYDFYFKFIGTSGDICHLDYFGFVTPVNTTASNKTSEELSAPTETLLSVYPNPATNMVNIQMAGSKSADISIYNQTGKIVYSTKNVSGTLSIPVNQIGGAGIYFVKTDTETKKLIISQ